MKYIITFLIGGTKWGDANLYFLPRIGEELELEGGKLVKVTRIVYRLRYLGSVFSNTPVDIFMELL